MKELFREQDITRVSYYQAVLEEYGIPTMIRNEHLTVAGLSEIPIPEFFPALCVLDDEDYVQAVAIIREHLTANQQNADMEITCISCGETNPGNFDVCWSCGNPVAAPRNTGQVADGSCGDPTSGHEMDKEGHQDAPGKAPTGCVLLGLFPFILVGSVFASGTLEEGGHKIAGWLWIPLSILVMFVFATIRYATTKTEGQPFSLIVFAKSVFGFVVKQILVLLVLGLIAMLLARLNPFSGMGNNW